ncbi:synapsin-2, partial [Reticulomyxa filosa]
LKAFKRYSMNWKGNVGNQSTNEDAEVTEQFKVWIEAAASIFGGLEICALDLVHDKEKDTFIILELNDTAIGLVKRHEIDDMNMMRDLAIAKMKGDEQKDDYKAAYLDAIAQIRKIEQKNKGNDDETDNASNKTKRDCLIINVFCLKKKKNEQTAHDHKRKQKYSLDA